MKTRQATKELLEKHYKDLVEKVSLWKMADSWHETSMIGRQEESYLTLHLIVHFVYLLQPTLACNYYHAISHFSPNFAITCYRDR